MFSVIFEVSELINMTIDDFLSQYEETIYIRALKLREILLKNLPDVKEQHDIPAKMVAYCYGQKYAELICVLIPSKKGLKLGFNRGVDLPDPDGLLEGTGKISRYVVINSEKVIRSAALKGLILAAYSAYRERMKSNR
jgi:hypothetical protein